MPHRVLLIAYYFPPVGMAGVQRPVRMVKYLTLAGWEVWTLTVKPIAYYAEDAAFSDDLDEAKILRSGSLDPARLMRLAGIQVRTPSGGNRRKGSGWLYRLSRYFCIPDAKILWTPFAVIRSLRQHWRSSFDAVITTSSPASAHIVGWALHQLCGIPWIMDYRDYWDGNVDDKDIPPAPRALSAALESFLVRRSNAVTAVSEELAAIAKMRGAPAVHVIRNGYDADDFAAPVTKSRNPRFILMHGGTANRQNDIRPLFGVLSHLVERVGVPEEMLELQQIGAVLDMDWDAAVQQTGLRCITRMPYLPHDRYIQHLRSADALVVCLSPQSRTGLIPGKIYEYLATGLPVLCLSGEGETAELVRQSGRGFVSGPDQTEIAAEQLDLMFKAWHSHIRPEPPDNSIRQYSRQVQAAMMADVLSAAIDTRNK